MKKLVVLGLLASAVVLGMATSAYANPSSSISISPTVVAAGHTVRISGSVPITPDCPATAARLTSLAQFFPPDGFGPFVSRNASGSFTFFFTVPASTPPGVFNVGLRCGGANVGVSASVRVTSQVTTVPTGGVATGAGGTADGPSGWWVALGIGCLALAAALIPVRLRLARQRR